MSLTILIAEDEKKVEKFIRTALEKEGMRVESVEKLDDVIPFLERSFFDVAILDRMLGRDDSLRIVPLLRRQFPKLRILILSALNESEQKTLGLRQGADDYLGKPFHIPELVERIYALCRRETAPIPETHTLRFGPLEIQLDRQEVKKSGLKIELSAKEFKLLTFLIRHPEKIHTREELLDQVWGLNADPGSNVVEVTIRRLRSKIESQGEEFIRTRRGSGYWMSLKDE